MSEKIKPIEESGERYRNLIETSLDQWVTISTEGKSADMNQALARDVTKEKKAEDKFRELLEAVYQKYGYDFRQYSEAHIKRRITNRMTMSGLEDVSEMQSKVLNDETFASILLQDLSITVAEMFRDPDFYRSLRGNVIPILKTYPFIKIWHAGCSTGEEVYFYVRLLCKKKGWMTGL